MSDEVVYLFEEPRVFEKINVDTKEVEFKFVVDRAFRLTGDPNDYLYIGAGDDEYAEAREYPVDLDDTNIDPETGDITFSVYDGDYVIRKLTPQDGKWLSRFGIDLPQKALLSLLARSIAGAPNIPQELLVAYSTEESTGLVIGVEYTKTNLGSFVRNNGMWLPPSSEDETFEDMFATFIDPNKAAEFLADYDKGGMTVEKADTYAELNAQN